MQKDLYISYSLANYEAKLPLCPSEQTLLMSLRHLTQKCLFESVKTKKVVAVNLLTFLSDHCFYKVLGIQIPSPGCADLTDWLQWPEPLH